MVPLAVLTALACAAVASAVPAGFVQAQGSAFVVDGITKRFAGTNNYYLIYAPRSMVDDVLTRAARQGLGYIRLWAFLDVGNTDGGWSIDGSGLKNGVYFRYWNSATNSPGTNTAALGNLDYVLYKAKSLGLRLILCLTNNWQGFGGMDQYISWRQRYVGGSYFNPQHDAFYTDAVIATWYKDWAATLVNRVNTFNGIQYKNDPTIFAWELANEPRCSGTGHFGSSGQCTSNYAVYGQTPSAWKIGQWVDSMSQYLRSIDPYHMIASGDEGFFCKKYEECPNWTCNCYSGVDTVAFTRYSAISFMSLHLYPKDWGFSGDSTAGTWGAQWITDHANAAASIGKPLLLGEYGHSSSSGDWAVAQVISQWTAAVQSSNAASSAYWMLCGKQSDGSWYPNYDGYCVWPLAAGEGGTPSANSQTLAVINSHSSWMSSWMGAPAAPSWSSSPSQMPAAPSPSSSPPFAGGGGGGGGSPGASGFVQAYAGKFWVNGMPKRFAGTNNYYLPYASSRMVDDVLTRAVQQNLGYIRTNAFIDIGSADGSGSVDGMKNGIYFRYWDPAVNAPVMNLAHLAKLDYVLYKAKQLGIRVMLCLTNNWKDFGGMDQYVSWRQRMSGGYAFTAQHDAFYKDGYIMSWYMSYASALINRYNTYTGIQYKDDPTIFSWELANEPRCQGSGTYSSSNQCTANLGSTSQNPDAWLITNWARTMSGFVRQQDPNHMVGVGDEGFWCQGAASCSPWDWFCNGYTGIDSVALTSISTVSYSSAHMYPKDWGRSADDAGAIYFGNKFIADHSAVAHALNKPFLLGEYGHNSGSGDGVDAWVLQSWINTMQQSSVMTDAAGYWMMCGKQDDGSWYPDYDGFCIYNPNPGDASSPTYTAAQANAVRAFADYISVFGTVASPSPSAAPVPVASTVLNVITSFSITGAAVNFTALQARPDLLLAIALSMRCDIAQAFGVPFEKVALQSIDSTAASIAASDISATLNTVVVPCPYPSVAVAGIMAHALVALGRVLQPGSNSGSGGVVATSLTFSAIASRDATAAEVASNASRTTASVTNNSTAATLDMLASSFSMPQSSFVVSSTVASTVVPPSTPAIVVGPSPTAATTAGAGGGSSTIAVDPRNNASGPAGASAVVGGVVGALLAVGLVGALVVVAMRRRQAAAASRRRRTMAASGNPVRNWDGLARDSFGGAKLAASTSAHPAVVSMTNPVAVAGQPPHASA